MKYWLKQSLFLLPVAGLLALSSVSVKAQEEDVTVEALYQKAVELNMSGNSADASKTFERLFELSGGYETLFEDFGAKAGGLLFDYGMTLLPQARWEDAKAVFTISVNAAEWAERVDSPIKSKNPRETLAKFQLGFCEAQLGNHEEALKLYDEYLAANPAAEELGQVRNSYKLRYGGSLMKLGRLDEGIAAIQELFDNREEWKVTPQFLMQGVLELGLVWVDRANAAGSDEVEFEKVAQRAHSFLDKNGSLVDLGPLDSYRFGFVDRLRKLGFESTKAGLYALALRYFAYVPTIQDVRDDVNLGLTRLPVGAGIPSQYQNILNQLDEREKAPLHPDAETLRLIATCYERMGSLIGPRAIYWHLSEDFPDVDPALHSEILHEASRLSSMLGDYPAAQYFGEKFMASSADDSPLKNNVSTFMLQSLFTSGQYDQVKSISERVRDRYEAGDAQRELADSLYPLALYSTTMHEDAVAPFAEYVKSYPDGGNREIVMYHRASNSLVLGKMREAAEQYEEFLKAFPESERFLDAGLADLAVARFNLEDYPASIGAVDRIIAEKPDSNQLGRTLNIKGDALLIMAGQLAKEVKEEQEPELKKNALEAYVAAEDAGEAAIGRDSDRADAYKSGVAESLWKSADLYYQNEEPEKGIAQFDHFFPTYAGANWYWEAQISVFSLEPLEAAGRGEEALLQVEKMILLLGDMPPEQQDITLLRQAIGSYSEASVRIRELEETLARLDKFPGMDLANQALLTWLKIQKVIVLQESRAKMKNDTPEYAAVEAQIGEVFEELRLFDKRKLSEFALQQVGLHFSKGDNPFLAVSYFEELLARTNPDADALKAPAEMALGEIEMRAADPAKVTSARERFKRVIKLGDKTYIAPAYMNLAYLHIKNKEWKDALAALDVINKDKNMFKQEKEKRAEAGFLLGTVYDELDDPVQANNAYLSVVSTYARYYDWVTQSWEKYIPNSIADFEKMSTATPEEQMAKRKRELALYKLTKKFLFQWQKLTDEDSPSGALRRLRRDISAMKAQMSITPEEELAVDTELGIAPAE